MLTRYEQETQIYFNEEEQDAEVYTASPVTYRKLMKLCQERPDGWRRGLLDISSFLEKAH